MGSGYYRHCLTLHFRYFIMMPTIPKDKGLAGLILKDPLMHRHE